MANKDEKEQEHLFTSFRLRLSKGVLSEQVVDDLGNVLKIEECEVDTIKNKKETGENQSK